MLRKVAALLTALMMIPCFSPAEEAVLVDGISNPLAAENFSFAEDAPLLEIIFPKIMDCDAALFRCGGKTLLLDCATPSQAKPLVKMLEQLGIERLDYIVNTHPHYDHIGGLGVVAGAVDVGAFYICHADNETEHMEKALKFCREKNIPVVRYGDGDRFELGGMIMDVWLKCAGQCSLNERSAQMRVQFGLRTALFTADMMPGTQVALLEHVERALLDVDWMKYPHHGKEKLTEDFLAATTPAFAVITNNSGKNSSESRKGLSYKQIPFACTVPGYVYCVTDGRTWLMKRLDMEEPLTALMHQETMGVLP